jgi:hypothetical protein
VVVELVLKDFVSVTDSFLELPATTLDSIARKTVLEKEFVSLAFAPVCEDGELLIVLIL